MKILLIWEQVPECTTPYILSGELAELALQSAGKYVNSANLPANHPIYKLSDALEELGGAVLSSEEPIDVSDIDKVVICGFIM